MQYVGACKLVSMCEGACPFCCVIYFFFFFPPHSDQVFPLSCNIERNFLSLNYLAGYLQPKTAEGCLMSTLVQEREVHIIELITPNSNPYR